MKGGELISNRINITMLGDFSIGCGDVILDESANRQRKVWLALSYLIYSRNSRVTQDGLLSVIRGADFTEIDDPAGRLKALLYRSRSLLDKLYDGAGHELITRRNNAYCWNPDIPVWLDVDEFEELIKESKTASDKLTPLRKAFKLYRGDFLPKLSMEPWVMPINAYFHQQYLVLCDSLLKLLEEGELWSEAKDTALSALKIEPYDEMLYRHLMLAYIRWGNKDAAIKTFEDMSELLFDTFGVMPSEESRKLYREASKRSNEQAMPMGDVADQLKEQEDPNGAMLCEYDYFRFLYQVQERAIERNGQEIHIALLSLHGKDDVSRKSLDLAMDNFGALLLSNLRRGDVISRCSVSQWIIMLPSANYENSCMVCNRVIKAFNRKYPHSPVEIKFSAHALTPHKPKDI